MNSQQFWWLLWLGVLLAAFAAAHPSFTPTAPVGAQTQTQSVKAGPGDYSFTLQPGETKDINLEFDGSGIVVDLDGDMPPDVALTVFDNGVNVSPWTTLAGLTNNGVGLGAGHHRLIVRVSASRNASHPMNVKLRIRITP